MEHLKYARKQYSIKQYGKYKSTEEPDDSPNIEFSLSKLRIRAVFENDEKGPWVLKDEPLEFLNNPNKIRIKTDLNEVIYAQTLLVKGKHKKVRIKNNNEIIISEEVFD